MNYICTWLCADEAGEESVFPQTGQLSSSRTHQDIYWRCLLLFFISSRRFNPSEKHILFTNVRSLPVVDGRDVGEVLRSLEVNLVVTDFKYKTPKGYFRAFQNQFYEFSILEYIAGKSNESDLQDQYLVVDSDCLFLKPAAPMFEAASARGFLSFRDEIIASKPINGLSRNDMRVLYAELLGRDVAKPPPYHLGEFLLCSVGNIQKIFADFLILWPELLRRFAANETKFNEEAHTLSYLYYKNDLTPAVPNVFMKRIWTNPTFYRDAKASDTDLVLWHLPSEKTYSLRLLYDQFIGLPGYGIQSISDTEYLNLVQRKTGIPKLGLPMRLNYYISSYYRAIHKRLPWKPLVKAKPQVQL